MNKKYKIEQFVECIKYINNNFPWMAVRTQIIVGFPQETEKDFLHTCELFDKASFNQVSIYQYKTSPYNPAADMGGQIPEEIKISRLKKLKRKIGYRSFSQTN
jgi:tRNA-2-methylthio-N6-dimethylallyladenosine synthase